jgi:subtilisin-like proprotein convertase family protein
MRSLLLLLITFVYSTSFTQNTNFWSTINESAIVLSADNNRGLVPDQYQTFGLDLEDIKAYLQNAPMHRTSEALSAPLLLDLPMSNGELMRFQVVESPVMKPGLAARFPHIKSFSGRAVKDENTTVKFLYSDHGFQAFLSTPNGRAYIERYATGIDDAYIIYDKKDLAAPSDLQFACGVHNSDEFLQQNNPLEGLEINDDHQHTRTQADNRSGSMAVVEIREYEIAIAGVAEWTALHGGDVSGGMSAVNTVVTLMNSVFETEVSVTFVLIEDNDQLIYTDDLTDPYSDVTNGGGLLQQNQNNLDLVIGTENYDIGHVMTIGCSGGLGGIAGGVICSENGKGRGVTCQGGSLQGAILNIAIHEVAHQFTASHTWDNCEGTISGGNILAQRSSGTAFEPGSGSTIMSYAGACGPQNVQFGSDDYYHVGSLQQMFNHIHDGIGGDCPDIFPAANNYPELELPYENGFYIPIRTPFELTAIASDVDGDELSYCWEQYNIGPLSNLGMPFGTAPSFRSWPPNDKPTRIFPRIQSVVNNTSLEVEVLPTYSRNLKFRCTVRDNNTEIGGNVWEEVSFEATEQAGPFRVQHPNDSGLSFEQGEYIEVLWDVANTDAAPVNASHVNIKLSTNGGFTYPYTLASNVPNDGVDSVNIPEILTTMGRIRVEAAENIFFDISNFNFQIVEATEPGFAFSVSPFSQQVCVPDDILIDLNTFGWLGYDSLVTFSLDGLPAGAVASFENNPTLVSEGTSITIETADVVDEGLFTIDIMAIAPSADTLVDMDTLMRTVTIDLVINDFTALALLEPANGSSGIVEVPTFTWTSTPNATSYSIEIADNPSFAPETIIETADGLTGSSYTPTVQLNQNTLHFWRLRPQNECGFGAYTLPQGFYTEIFSCSTFESNDVPINISGVGTPTIESTLVIGTDIIINDLNVSKIKGSHDLVKHLDVTLISPDETEVLLFSGECGVATAFDMALDDEAASEIGQCFNGTFLPEGMLSDFDGSQSIGTWTLRVAVNNPDGTGGSLQEWALELCSNASASPPYLVTNETMPLPPGQSRQITDEFLLSQDDDNGPEELTYTVVTGPAYGTLLFQNEPVEVGMTFRQSSLNAGNVRYVHDGGPETVDGFTFAVEDGQGGWFGTPFFEIEIDPSVVVSTENLTDVNSFTVFPNPAQDRLNIQFKQAVNGRVDIQLTNVQGQLLQSQRFDNALEQVQLNTSNLTDGIYFIYVKTESGTATQKVVIQR